MNRGYLDEIRRLDVSRVSDRRRDPVKVARLLQSLARNVATPVAISKLAADVGDNGRGLKSDTVAEYLDALERLMLVENQPAWAPHLRSRTTLRSTPVRHFVDPSLAAAAMRVTPTRLSADPECLGLLFESMVIRDLRVYAQAADAHVFHYREKEGLEVDAVVEAADGRWAAFEIKLGERWVADGAKSLNKLARRMERSDHEEPSALAVIVPNGYGHVGRLRRGRDPDRCTRAVNGMERRGLHLPRNAYYRPRQRTRSAPERRTALLLRRTRAVVSRGSHCGCAVRGEPRRGGAGRTNLPRSACRAAPILPAPPRGAVTNAHHFSTHRTGTKGASKSPVR